MMQAPLNGIALVALATTAAAGDITWHELDVDGTPLHYALVTPPATFTGPRPTLLALPPGNQSRRMVEAGLGRYWGERAAERGWIVVSPVAPEETSFWSGAETAIPALLDHIASTHTIDGGRFHLAGASNGGRSAFRVGGLFPERFRSITVLPGFPATPDDEARLDHLRLLPIAMFAGGDDTRWVDATERAAAQLREIGADVQVRILPGEGHVPPGLDGPVIMDHLERTHAICGVHDALDAFHAAADRADGTAYFDLLTPDAVFIGTDPDERWTKDAFRAFAEPYFERGRGWTYSPAERHVAMETGGALAWFDENLDNAKYGRCRGTGVVRKTDAGWRIAQYVLTIPIPNDLAGDVVERIRGRDTVAP